MFFKKKKPPLVSPNAEPGELGLFVKSELRRLSQWLAGRLNRWDKKRSVPQKKFAITAFCFLMGLLFMTTLYHGLFIRPAKAPAYLRPHTMTIPVNPHLPDSLLYGPYSRHGQLPPQVRYPDSLIK